MSRDLLYEQQLLREHDLLHRVEVADLNSKKAQLSLAEAEKEVKGLGLGRLLPFMAKAEKATIETAVQRLEHWKKKKTEYLSEHAEAEQQLDISTLTHIREHGAEEYLKGQKIKDFYGLAQERVDVFRMRVRDFLKALGQARGAMSTGYNNATEDYSQNAKDRLDVALRVAHKLDIALSDVELLNAEFKAKAEGTPYSKIKMPSFSQVEYEAGVRRARTMPIAQAQAEFEKTLSDCEQLHDEGIGEVIDEINDLKHSHEDIMREIVREYWRGQQVELLRNASRVQEIRSQMIED